MLVLDTNILISAVLDRRIRELLIKYFATVGFVTPDTAFAEAREHLPEILRRRGIDPEPGVEILHHLWGLVGSIDSEIYGQFETSARQRLQNRDEEDWPVLATALALESPIWTEDADFFGTGVATWTTDRIELLLRQAQADVE